MENKPENVIIATEENFEEVVVDRSRSIPVMVDFWADWCPPCRTMDPVLVKVASRRIDSLVLAKVEIDDNMHLAGKYKLTGFPSVLLFLNGEEVGRFAGAKNETGVEAFLSEHLAGNLS